MYIGVLAIWIVGVIIARFRPPGMVRALSATALAQALIAGIAVIAGLVDSPLNGTVEVLIINGFFVALFVGSALLFRHAAREAPAGAGQKGWPASGSPSGWICQQLVAAVGDDLSDFIREALVIRGPPQESVGV